MRYAAMRVPRLRASWPLRWALYGTIFTLGELSAIGHPQEAAVARGMDYAEIAYFIPVAFGVFLLTGTRLMLARSIAMSGRLIVAPCLFHEYRNA
jgi:hypothetical protein